ncbi:hypothetical protein [Phascolarctobacterium succinatutens]|uniref:hypothetical protein n=1 Tax=Phascolarctobacterium succinatutens TaxID=626940 RepID=UPI003AB7592E
MIDYQKAGKALELLKESGVAFVLAYSDNIDKHAISAFGEYSKLKCFAVDIMGNMANNLCDKYGEDIASQELIKMALLAVHQLHDKKWEE